MTGWRQIAHTGTLHQVEKKSELTAFDIPECHIILKMPDNVESDRQAMLIGRYCSRHPSEPGYLFR